MDDADQTGMDAQEPPDAQELQSDRGTQRERAAAADLVRMAEPGDVLLRS